jgi:hypothetical protein
MGPFATEKGLICGVGVHPSSSTPHPHATPIPCAAAAAAAAQSAFLPLMLLPQEPARRLQDLEPINNKLTPDFAVATQATPLSAPLESAARFLPK